MRARVRFGAALLATAAACADDDGDPLGPILDGVTPEEGVAMCTPLGADSSWSFARLGAGTKPALAAAEDGTVHAAFMSEAIDGWVRYARLPSGATAPSLLEPVALGYFYGPIDLVIGPDGEARVLYHDHDREDQVLARRSGSTGWELHAMANEGHDGWYNAGVFDEAGVLHTASYDPRGFGGRGVIYGAWDGSDWSVELAAPGSFDYAGGLAITGGGSRIEVAFFDDLAGEARIASRDGPGSWSVSTVEPLADRVDVGRFPDMEYHASSGELHLVYLARTAAAAGTVRYARGTPTSLATRDLADVADFAIGFDGARDIATLALDSQGTPLVAVQTRSELTLLAVRASSVESLASLVAPAGVAFGQQTEIAVDGQDRPHVVWWQSGESPGTVCHGVRG